MSAIFVEPKSKQAIDRLNRLFQLQNEAFLKNQNPSAKERKELLNRVPDMMIKYRDKLLQGLVDDFGNHPTESADLFEISGMIDTTKEIVGNLDKWMKISKRAINPVVYGGSKAYVKYQPKGVIGNMSAWNFPIQESIGPMLDMLGAGNRVIIKPSDMTPATGAVLQEMIADTFDEEQVAVVNGEVSLAEHFSTLPWNHLLYTGNGRIGSLVMQNCAKNLTPVTLELGGKSPTIIDRDSLTEETIKMIVGIKVLKRGQICVNTDYLFVPEDKADQFVASLAAYWQKHFAADNGRANGCNIISGRHTKRLQELVKEAKAAGAEVIQIGSEGANDVREMPFYIVVNPDEKLGVMQEEIFGPILPIKTYTHVKEVTDYINKGGSPLGLYIFSKNKAFVDQITDNTRSGGVCVNAVALQAAHPSLPFGGVGASGMGRFHGIEGFREFSNPRGYFEKGEGGTIDWIMPPFGEKTRTLINDVVYGPIFKQLKFAMSRLPKVIRGKMKS